ncbi:hypothetical protein PV04_03480 [Phialophora macrospora]|uniref:CREG-like beta-barrel domain-containing protein n=1 Tax=Phialophora macrospora TaxID=1851006 RepID=A0A0D2FSC1_9EURO|nr:hypothetical protein PV04_03480 [Phialophora macrospora]
MKLPSALLAVAQLLALNRLALGAPVTEADRSLDVHRFRARYPSDGVQSTDGSSSSSAPPSQLHLHEPLPYETDEQDQDQDQDGASPSSSIPSRYQSTLLARRLLHLSSHGDLITVFPAAANLSSRIPASVASTPIGLPEYIATCEKEGESSHAADPTILSLKISTATRNAEAGSNATLSLSWWDEFIHLTGHAPFALANLPRLSLTGYLEEIPPEDSPARALEACFVHKHKDSVMWLPGRKWAAHEGVWTRLVVQQAYWIGGFGDKNYIGWLDPEEWRAVRKDEWEAVRLPGEKD